MEKRATEYADAVTVLSGASVALSKVEEACVKSLEWWHEQLILLRYLEEKIRGIDGLNPKPYKVENLGTTWTEAAQQYSGYNTKVCDQYVERYYHKHQNRSRCG